MRCLFLTIKNDIYVIYLDIILNGVLVFLFLFFVFIGFRAGRLLLSRAGHRCVFLARRISHGGF